jgi:glycerol-3-phosphate acyltransferase PlsX
MNTDQARADGIIRIGLDAMGGDYAPESVIEGAALAQQEANGGFQILLVGNQDKINHASDRLRHKLRHRVKITFPIRHAPEHITMEDQPGEAVRRKNTSIAVAMQLQKEGELDAVVSAGNTGVAMANALLTMGRLENIDRPALAMYLPTQNERGVLILDVGANAYCKPDNLYEFGVMGSVYSSVILNKEKSSVGLLSIGEEKSKGSPVTVETHKILQEGNLNFVGNVEGNDVLRGKVDVVVCDGFVGNIIIKLAGSFEGFLAHLLRRQVRSNLLSKMGVFFLKYTFKRLKKTLDYAEYGGAPLLGVNGVNIICHGSSSPKAIKNAVRVAANMVRRKVNDRIRKMVNYHMLANGPRPKVSQA